jgi:hypothetical protein
MRSFVTITFHPGGANEETRGANSSGSFLHPVKSAAMNKIASGAGLRERRIIAVAFSL